MGIRRIAAAALFAAAFLPAACDAGFEPTEGEVLTSANGAITAEATAAEATTAEATTDEATTDDATTDEATTDEATGTATAGAEPLYYANGPCGRSPTLAQYLYKKVWAEHLHDCNVIALETSRATGLWLFGAYRSDTHECCLFLQPNSRY